MYREHLRRWGLAIKALFFRPRYEDSPEWKQSSEKCHRLLRSIPDEDHSWLSDLRDVAEKHYADALKLLLVMDEKAHKLIQTNLLVMGAVFTVHKATDSGVSLLTLVSLVAILLSVAVLALSRRAFGKTLRADISDLLESLLCNKPHQAVIAMDLDDAISGLRYVAAIQSRQQLLATWLSLAGMAGLTFALFISRG